MKKTGVLLIAVAALTGCQSDPEPPVPGPVAVPVLITAGTYPMQVHHHYASPTYPDYKPELDVDTLYVDSLVVSGNKDTIVSSLMYGLDESKYARVLALIEFSGDTAIYRQPHPGFPTAWTLKYDTLSKKIEYSVITRTNHIGTWSTIARSL